MTVDLLRRHPLFSGLPESDLQQLVQQSARRSLAPGEVLLEEGGRAEAMYFVLGGDFEIVKRSGDREIPLAVRGPGEVLGEMSLLDDAPHSATVRAVSPATVLSIAGSAFHRLISSSPAAALAILHTVTSRLRHTESMLRQSEKMAALGTLAAGVAHELNNPAAAARRSSGQLADSLTAWARTAARLVRLPLPAQSYAALDRLVPLAVPHDPPHDSLGPLERSDREAEMEAWLTTLGTDQPWNVAPHLVAAGLDPIALDEATRSLPSEPRAAVVEWLAQGAVVSQLVHELGHSAQRISEIVAAVKSYSYLDRAPVQEVDVHHGLEDSLLLLRHKLEGRVRVRRQFAADLPRIEAYASELNQVWTNLIDNAADALPAGGEIMLRTRREGDHVVVEVQDDGPGIPAEIVGRVFEPFFTTKPPGSGTGLGLHISQEIVVAHHGGAITVASRPGQTTFAVRLPIRLPRRSD